MARFDRRFLSMAIAIGLLAAAAVTLTACGRKGALEAPPSATTVDERPSLDAAKPDHKSFILDPLL